MRGRDESCGTRLTLFMGSARVQLYRACLFCLFLGVWIILAQWLDDPALLPGPATIVLDTLPSFATSSGRSFSLWNGLAVISEHSFVTVGRVAVAFPCGLLTGYMIGCILHVLPREVRQVGSSVVAILKAVPLLALIPLFLYWFSSGLLGTLSYVGLAVFVVAATAAWEAGFNVPPEYRERATLLSATKAQSIAWVLLPAIGWELLGSLRYLLGAAWAFSLGAEYLGGSSGLGYLAYQSYLYSSLGRLIVCLGVYCLLGIGTHLAWRVVERRVLGLSFHQRSSS